jgi:hypothetical protein
MKSRGQVTAASNFQLAITLTCLAIVGYFRFCAFQYAATISHTDGVSINVFYQPQAVVPAPCALRAAFLLIFASRRPVVKAGRVDRGGVDRPLQLPLGLAKCMVAVLANRRFSGQGQGAVGSS